MLRLNTRLRCYQRFQSRVTKTRQNVAMYTLMHFTQQQSLCLHVTYKIKSYLP